MDAFYTAQSQRVLSDVALASFAEGNKVDQPIIVLRGESGSGKSGILEALRQRCVATNKIGYFCPRAGRPVTQEFESLGFIFRQIMGIPKGCDKDLERDAIVKRELPPVSGHCRGWSCVAEGGRPGVKRARLYPPPPPGYMSLPVFVTQTNLLYTLRSPVLSSHVTTISSSPSPSRARLPHSSLPYPACHFTPSPLHRQNPKVSTHSIRQSRVSRKILCTRPLGIPTSTPTGTLDGPQLSLRRKRSHMCFCGGFREARAEMQVSSA